MQTLQDFCSATFINRLVNGLIKVSWVSSVLEERRAGTLRWFWSPRLFSATVCEVDQREHLRPAPCPSTKSKMAAITETQWRGKIRVPKVFSGSIRAKTSSDLSPRAVRSTRDGSVVPGFPLHRCTSYNFLSPHPVFYYPWPSVAGSFGNNNDVLQLPDLIRELR